MPRLQERGCDAPQTEGGAIVTAREAAALCGVTPHTIYKWVKEGRMSVPFDPQNLPTPRPRGPRRNRYSIRYGSGRHSFDEVRKST